MRLAWNVFDMSGLWIFPTQTLIMEAAEVYETSALAEG
jgi:hypothetical protein